MRRRIGLVLAIVMSSALSATIGWFAHGPRHDVGEYAKHRLAAIRQHLDEADPGFVLIAGDSQAELQTPSARVCGATVVNAGISGATPSDYAALLPDLAFPVRARAAVLTIGTNDLARKNNPLSSEALARFEDDVGRIVTRLAAVSDRVVVTAVPPLGRDIDDSFEARAVSVYSERIRVLCARLGCVYADPFASLRDGTSGFGKPGANRDGLHLARYRPLLGTLAAALCPDEAATPPP